MRTRCDPGGKRGTAARPPGPIEVANPRVRLAANYCLGLLLPMIAEPSRPAAAADVELRPPRHHAPAGGQRSRTRVDVLCAAWRLARLSTRLAT